MCKKGCENNLFIALIQEQNRVFNLTYGNGKTSCSQTNSNT